MTAIKLNDKNEELFTKFAAAIKFARFEVYNELIKEIIVKCFTKNSINHQNLAVPGVSILKLSENFQEVACLISAQNPIEVISEALKSNKLKILEDVLLINLLEKTIIPDKDLERFMTNMRHALLNCVAEKKFFDFKDSYIPFIYALSMQCFNNEYVFSESTEEAHTVEQLIQKTHVNSDNINDPK